MSESVELQKNSFLELWQSYCDKKMECESLVEEAERLRGERDELVDAMKVCQEYVDSQFEQKISTHNPAYIGRIIANVLAKIKGEDNE